MEHEPSYCKFCGEKLSRKRKDGRDRFYCESCDRFLWQDHSPAAAVMIEREEKILVVKRDIEPWKGSWSLPAGYIEIDEAPIQAARRELEEETGVRVEPEDLEAYRNFHLEHPDGKDTVVLVYRATDFQGEPEAKDETIEADFIDPDDLKKSPLLQKTLRSRENE